MKVEATVKSIRISPRKVRLVVDEVRGKSAVQAESMLQFMNTKGAEIVLKLVRSAIANAGHNNNLAKKDLLVSEITVGEGFTIKRFMPRAFGRATPIRKRTSHIRVVLTETEEARKAREAGKKVVKKVAAKQAVEAPKAKAEAAEGKAVKTEKGEPVAEAAQATKQESK